MKSTFIVILVLGFCAFWLFQERSKDFCHSITIVDFSSGKSPFLEVEVEGKKLSVELDLGYDGDVCLTEKVVEKIKDKTFKKTSRSVGFQGISREHKSYAVPQIKIGDSIFYNPVLEEENLGFLEDAAIRKTDFIPKISDGRLGCKLFHDKGLFLDLGRCKMTICDSIKTLKKNGYDLSDFVKVPFATNRNLILFDIATSQGTLKCMLDSGCTWNQFHTDDPLGSDFRELNKSEAKFIDFSNFQIDGKDFGKITFHPLPIKFPMLIQAILGMEFLLRHQIFIDFKNREIYLSGHEVRQEEAELKDQEVLPFFVTLPVLEFYKLKAPLLDVVIEGKKTALELDLGFNGDICLESSIAKTLKQKSFLRTRWIYGIKGNKHPRQLFKVPEVQLGQMTFADKILEEDSEMLMHQGVVIKGMKEGAKVDADVVGKLGWKFFKDMALFIDLPNAKIAACHGPEALVEEGCSLEKFVQVPILTDHDLIEFETMTSKGPMKCILNTNCAVSFMHIDKNGEESIEDMVIDEARFIEFAEFKIGGKDMGKVTFRPLTITLPIPIEAILGMDFLANHPVLIDFKNRQIYISP